MKTLLLLTISAVAAFAQTAQDVRLSTEPIGTAFTVITHYTSNVADYICKAKSTQEVSTITVAAISNANPASMTATAHGLYFATSVTQKIVAFISGLTGNWTPLNGMHVLTPTSANALATDVDTSGFGAVTGTVVVSTRAPKITAKIWSVASWVADASGNTTIQAWSVPTTGTTLADLRGGQTSFAFACAAPVAFQ